MFWGLVVIVKSILHNLIKFVLFIIKLYDECSVQIEKYLDGFNLYFGINKKMLNEKISWKSKQDVKKHPLKNKMAELNLTNMIYVNGLGLSLLYNVAI